MRTPRDAHSLSPLPRHTPGTWSVANSPGTQRAGVVRISPPDQIADHPHVQLAEVFGPNAIIDARYMARAPMMATLLRELLSPDTDISNDWFVQAHALMDYLDGERAS